MPKPSRIGFIGFGEAGSNIAKGLRVAGVEALAAFDIKTDDPQFGPTIRERAAEASTAIVGSSAELVAASDIIMSTVTASAAADAARQTVKFLKSGQLYADLNSVSPALKQEIDRLITETGATFVEVAVMAPVPPYLQRVPMLVGAAGAARFVEMLSPYGMRLEVVPEKSEP